MPLGYGGGIRTLADAKSVFDIGFEKIAVNSYAVENPEFISHLAEIYGSQSIIVSIDVKMNFWGHYRVCIYSGRKMTNYDPVVWAQTLEKKGAGEILLTSVDREGTWAGFDLDLVKQVAAAVNIPVIAHGGAGAVAHIGEVVKKAGASAVALGSMVVFQKKGMGVLVNFPDHQQLKEVLG